MSDIVLVSPPDIPDGLLLFNEEETRQIYRFFWPHLRTQINEMEITNERRRLAQQLLIVGIDSTYAIGFIEGLIRMPLGGLRPGFTGLVTMGRKLASSYFKHWWKHAKQDDLRNPRIAELVRFQIALNFKTPAEEAIKNASARPRLSPFYMAATMTTSWGGA